VVPVYFSFCPRPLCYCRLARCCFEWQCDTGANQGEIDTISVRAVDNCSLSARRIHLWPVSRRIGLAGLCARSIASKMECAGVESDSGCHLDIMAPTAVFYQRYPLLHSRCLVAVVLAVHDGSYSVYCHIHMDFQQHSAQHACGNPFPFHSQFNSRPRQCDSWHKLLFNSIVDHCGDNRRYILGCRYIEAT